MKLNNSAILLILFTLFQGCAVNLNAYMPTKDLESPKPESTASTKMVSTVSVISTASAAITSFPTYNNTPSVTTRPSPTSQTTCPTRLPELSDNISYQGKVTLLSSLIYNGPKNYYELSSIYDLNVRKFLPVPIEKVLGLKPSPDGKKYAVRDANMQQIKIYSTDGRLLKSLPKGEFPFGIDRWLDNESILLVVEQPIEGMSYMKYPRDEIIVNLLTNEMTRLPSTYPDIDKTQAQMVWEGFSTTKYDPGLTRVVYPAGIDTDYLGNQGNGYILWDIVKKKKVVQIATGGLQITPKWSPDGSSFIVNTDYIGNGEFYLVTRDGEVSQVSNLNYRYQGQKVRPHYYSDSYSWSPDGHTLAFWNEEKHDNAIKATLAILDTNSGNVTDLCLSAGIEEKGENHLPNFYVPVWSPDGKYIVTVANLQTDGGIETVFIDLEWKVVTKIAENLYPSGWLVDKEK